MNQAPEAPEVASDGDSADYTLATVVVCVVLFFLIAIGFWSWNTSKTSCAAQRVAQHAAAGGGCSCGCMAGARAAKPARPLKSALKKKEKKLEKKHQRFRETMRATPVHGRTVGREAATVRAAYR